MEVFPEDWKVDVIGKLVAIETGSKNTQDSVNGGNYPFYVRSEVVERINEYTHDTEGVVTAGDGVGTGKIFHYVEGKFALHQRCYLMHGFKEPLDSKYFYWFFKTNFHDRIASMTAKSSVDSVRREMIAGMTIAYPESVEEQRRIAAALGDMDKLIDNLSKRIEKKKAIKQGAMQELLTGKKRLPGFEGEWEKVELVEIGQVLKGRGISRAESKTGEIPAIRYGEIYTHHNDYVKTYVSHVSEAVAAKALRLKRGDVVFAGSGETVEEIGKSVSVVDDGVCAGGDTIVFSPWEETDPLFWGFLLNIPYVQRQKSLSGHGATIIHIRPSAIKKIQVEIPDVAEQRAIAKVLGDMDAEIARLEAKREKLTGIKKGMMSDLLTGKVRLKTEMERRK